ncbi:hypothetical protein KY329_04595 [Candidatus Woesearchaeota archaeon]|nr:hypothetical protein [Candidatus Woesearchaeota archaeon]
MQMIKKFFIHSRELLTDSKIFIQRSLSYVAILNSGMILFLMLAKLENYGIDINLTKWFLPIFIMTVAGMITVGFIDTKLGFFAEEKRRIHNRDPHEKDIIRRLDKIEKLLQRKV